MKFKPLLPRWVWATALLPALLIVPAMVNMMTSGIAAIAIIAAVTGTLMMLTAIGGFYGMLQLHRTWRAVKLTDDTVSIRTPGGPRVTIPIADITDIRFDTHRNGAQVPTIVRSNGTTVHAALGYITPGYRNGIWYPSRTVDSAVTTNVETFGQALLARGAPLTAGACWIVVHSDDTRYIVRTP